VERLRLTYVILDDYSDAIAVVNLGGSNHTVLQHAVHPCLKIGKGRTAAEGEMLVNLSALRHVQLFES
jgi:hypothetical protein